MDLEEQLVTTQIHVEKVNSLALKIKNFDTAGSGGTQPVSVWWKNEGVDNVASF